MAIPSWCEQGGQESCSSHMFSYFSAVAGHNDRARALLCELSCAESFGKYDEGACEKFKAWFTEIKPNRQDFEDFKVLLSSPHFMDLCNSLYDGKFRLYLDEAILHLKSSDGQILGMDKSVATAESVVLKDLIDSTGGQVEINVPRGSGNVLSQVLDFCQKTRDFDKALESFLGHYKGWVTSFLTSNQAILPDLHTAADFLHIPSLLTWTTQAMTDQCHDFSHPSGIGLERMFPVLGETSLLSIDGGNQRRVGVAEDVPHDG